MDIYEKELALVDRDGRTFTYNQTEIDKFGVFPREGLVQAMMTKVVISSMADDIERQVGAWPHGTPEEAAARVTECRQFAAEIGRLMSPLELSLTQ